MHCGGQCHQILCVKIDGHKGVQALPDSRQPEALPGHSSQLELLWQINAPARHKHKGRRQAAEAVQVQSYICKACRQSARCGLRGHPGCPLPASRHVRVMYKAAREHMSSDAVPPPGPEPCD